MTIQDSFIFQDYLQDLSICDELIQYYKNSDKKTEGKSSVGIDHNVKKSTEISVDNFDEPIVKNYLGQLQVICNKYIKTYKFCNEYGAWDIMEGFNIQHYKPNEGYFTWHCERGNAVEPFNNRHLVWMTYLNDVDDEGETEFYYQGLKVKPKKGLTLIWVADWTHTHRGITSPTQEKYIATGWYSYKK
jgi:hypothetical protein